MSSLETEHYGVDEAAPIDIKNLLDQRRAIEATDDVAEARAARDHEPIAAGRRSQPAG
jgi:hypothetical protein